MIEARKRFFSGRPDLHHQTYCRWKIHDIVSPLILTKWMQVAVVAPQAIATGISRAANLPQNTIDCLEGMVTNLSG